MAEHRKSTTDAQPEAPTASVARAVAGEVAQVASGRIYTLLAAVMMAFAGVFLMIGWQFGPLPLIEAQQYRKFTGHVDAPIVESWIALEFASGDVRAPEFWRASTNASGCIVVAYGGEWGTPLRRAFCGTRTKFNESWPVAHLRDLSPDVPFAWARDANGFVVPELRVDPGTVRWLTANVPNRFMHREWPATTALDWLRIELDDPLAAAIAGWSAPPPVVKLAFDPERPAEALPVGIIANRVKAGPSWPAVVVGFGVGLFVWFKATALLPLVQSLAPAARWILCALPLLTLPWWLDSFPVALRHFSSDLAMVVRDMFADIERTDRLVASEPGSAMLADGERLVWRLSDSVYADTFGTFRFMPPNPPAASNDAAFAALRTTITAQVRALDDGPRAELFARLVRDKALGLDAVAPVFRDAAQEAAGDPAASVRTRRAAARFLQ